MACVDCAAPGAPYRYKCCGRNFCGVACYQQHSCTPEEAKHTGVAGGSGNEAVTLRKDDGAVDLSETQLAALKGDEKLRSMLLNGALRKVLRTVVEAPDPYLAMAPYLRDEFFAGFVTQVLDTLTDLDAPAIQQRKRRVGHGTQIAHRTSLVVGGGGGLGKAVKQTGDVAPDEHGYQSRNERHEAPSVSQRGALVDGDQQEPLEVLGEALDREVQRGPVQNGLDGKRDQVREPRHAQVVRALRVDSGLRLGTLLAPVRHELAEQQLAPQPYRQRLDVLGGLDAGAHDAPEGLLELIHQLEFRRLLPHRAALKVHVGDQQVRKRGHVHLTAQRLDFDAPPQRVRQPSGVARRLRNVERVQLAPELRPPVVEHAPGPEALASQHVAVLVGDALVPPLHDSGAEEGHLRQQNGPRELGQPRIFAAEALRLPDERLHDRHDARPALLQVPPDDAGERLLLLQKQPQRLFLGAQRRPLVLALPARAHILKLHLLRPGLLHLLAQLAIDRVEVLYRVARGVELPDLAELHPLEVLAPDADVRDARGLEGVLDVGDEREDFARDGDLEVALLHLRVVADELPLEAELACVDVPQQAGGGEGEPRLEPPARQRLGVGVVAQGGLRHDVPHETADVAAHRPVQENLVAHGLGERHLVVVFDAVAVRDHEQRSQGVGYQASIAVVPPHFVPFLCAVPVECRRLVAFYRVDKFRVVVRAGVDGPLRHPFLLAFHVAEGGEQEVGERHEPLHIRLYVFEISDTTATASIFLTASRPHLVIADGAAITSKGKRAEELGFLHVQRQRVFQQCQVFRLGHHVGDKADKSAALRYPRFEHLQERILNVLRFLGEAAAQDLRAHLHGNGCIHFT
ncbi:MYND Zn-finger protein/hormone receptor interactor, putative [Babesia caballi]|uniref:MYND Zn-finger protein/hormone receptor interactor, putative n=1 Tax=Babesia caballi TaxID=5871 RepID=A0AAV4LV57_BABCB|nr:MYND Zn-finger protein/hormone receptor interactor, putative [Babesia caballi]